MTFASSTMDNIIPASLIKKEADESEYDTAIHEQLDVPNVKVECGEPCDFQHEQHGSRQENIEIKTEKDESESVLSPSEWKLDVMNEIPLLYPAPSNDGMLTVENCETGEVVVLTEWPGDENNHDSLARNEPTVNDVEIKTERNEDGSGALSAIDLNLDVYSEPFLPRPVPTNDDVKLIVDNCETGEVVALTEWLDDKNDRDAMSTETSELTDGIGDRSRNLFSGMDDFNKESAEGEAHKTKPKFSKRGVKNSHGAVMKKNFPPNIESPCTSQQMEEFECTSVLKTETYKKYKSVNIPHKMNDGEVTRYQETEEFFDDSHSTLSCGCGHSGQSSHTCEVFKNRYPCLISRLNDRRICSGKWPHKCEVCKKFFTSRSSLVNHATVHTGERPYKCKVCNKFFSQSSSLRTHAKCHTGERPYKCEVCNKSFIRSSYLTSHARVHSGERPYKCEVCNKLYTRSSSLLEHTRLHTGEYKCEVCDKSFMRSQHLKAHARLHTGEQPYKCEVCDKLFTQSSYLRNHARVHTWERP